MDLRISDQNSKKNYFNDAFIVFKYITHYTSIILSLVKGSIFLLSECYIHINVKHQQFTFFYFFVQKVSI